MKRGLFALILLLAALASRPALAHKPSDSYLTIRILGADSIAGRWDIALRDLDYALGLDADGDGAITWGEVRRRQADIVAYALARLDLKGRAGPCPAAFEDMRIDRHSDGAYAVLNFSAPCAGAGETLTVGYRLFFDIDPQHKGLLNLVTAGASQSAVFSPDAPARTFAVATSLRKQVLDYLVTGVGHIATGDDHILFLVTLLLPAVLRRSGSRWLPEPSLATAARETLKIVTAFTLAHALTLSVAASGMIHAPSRWVEAAIALSIVVAALNNLHPFIGGRRWAVAFGFGLIHGFGFANILADLGLPAGLLALALLGFNLGVELGQAAIAAVVLPYVFLVRGSFVYRRIAMDGGSVATALIAAVWFVERAFNMQLITVR